MKHRSSIVSSLALGAALVAGLTGCQPSDQPTVVETPAITWDPGSPEPRDEFETAVRDSEIGRALAFNLRDFTIDQLTSTSTATSVEGFYDAFRAEYVTAGATPRVKAGPQPYSITEVVAAGDDAASVTVCYPKNEWWIESGHPEPSIEASAGGQTAVYRVGLDGDVLKVLSVSASTDPCEVGDLVVGRFDPEPQPPTSISERDIRPPL